jgi:hypothetical protein
MTAMWRYALVLLCAAGCTQPRSKTCSDICAREAECHEHMDTHENFDEGECLDACAALERDAQMTEVLKKHADCVLPKDKSCEQVLVCH